MLTAGSEEDVVVDGATWERKSEGVGGGRDGLPFLRRWGSSVAKWGSELMAERGRWAGSGVFWSMSPIVMKSLFSDVFPIKILKRSTFERNSSFT